MSDAPLYPRPERLYSGLRLTRCACPLMSFPTNLPRPLNHLHLTRPRARATLLTNKLASLNVDASPHRGANWCSTRTGGGGDGAFPRNCAVSRRYSRWSESERRPKDTMPASTHCKAASSAGDSRNQTKTPGAGLRYAADAPVETGPSLHPRHVAGFSRRPDVRKGVRFFDVFRPFPMPPCARTNPNKNQPLPPNSRMVK